MKKHRYFIFVLLLIFVLAGCNKEESNKNVAVDSSVVSENVQTQNIASENNDQNTNIEYKSENFELKSTRIENPDGSITYKFEEIEITVLSDNYLFNANKEENLKSITMLEKQEDNIFPRIDMMVLNTGIKISEITITEQQYQELFLSICSGYRINKDDTAEILDITIMNNGCQIEFRMNINGKMYPGMSVFEIGGEELFVRTFFGDENDSFSGTMYEIFDSDIVWVK